ncbi:hypothetical protein L3X38_025668 [Prunus dulcis]|uniref:Retrotransposon gag protein n=2 Tax=Prunus dulcis TaxID=3755 RepID=A0AAD4W237_PRUDU|nr:hypothetical protein L3X38_025668 [Prunus dulcis]
MVDSTIGGSLMDKTADEAINAFKTICENSKHWDFPTKDSRVAPTLSTQKGGIYEVSVRQVTAQPCNLCASIAHDTANCPSNPILEDVQGVNEFNGRPRNDPYSNTYNPGWRQHPNFSWSNSHNTMGTSNSSKPFQQPYQTPPTQHEDPSIKEILSQLLKKLDRYEQEVASLKQSQSVLEKSQSKCEVRLGQIATTLNRLERTQGQFPSQTEANPRNHDQVQAITTLRSGKVIDNKIGNSEITDKEEDEVMTESRHQLDKQSEDSLKSNNHVESVNHTLPTQNTNTMVLYPSLNVVDRFVMISDICTNKRRFEAHEKVMLFDNVSVVLQRKLPPKLQDSGSFTIPCTIGKTKFDKALHDLGASVNLMPYFVYEHLGLGGLKHIFISLQFEDRSVKYLRGIVEDVLIHVDQFILPADFVILDMEEAEISGCELPLILGRPFMATAGTKIDAKSGLLTMTVQDITVNFQVLEALKRPIDPYGCFHVEVMDRIIEKTFIELSLKDPLEICISQHGMSFEKATILATEEDLNVVTSYLPWSQPKFEILPSSHAKLIPFPLSNLQTSNSSPF